MDIQEQNIAAKFDAVEEPSRARLLALRDLIFDVAKDLPEIGELLETLKWGEPSYLPSKKCVGTTVRIGPSKLKDYAVFVHCQTTLIDDFRHMFPDEFHYEGNRGIHFSVDEPLPEDQLRLFIANALTYHLK
ncbi:hypothetical protein MXMO3_00642 [Maritalea myrionectae]|uniref:YdhG-like domain-containing protein n=1 Tax=Maritalea myrionectae TaxID=454601 RepID=A0A2R4MBC0_9HYPH|nr:DUF1801 domain-containing protein [Maritalea myrionectae]AVX03176.1 hypothetical protein MXMO3_00642 [Maritalea myrionectae]